MLQAESRRVVTGPSSLKELFSASALLRKERSALWAAWRGCPGGLGSAPGRAGMEVALLCGLWSLGSTSHAGELVAAGTGVQCLRVFSSPWQLCPTESSAGVARPLASQEPWPPWAREHGTVRVLSLGSASWHAEGLGAALYLSAQQRSIPPGAGRRKHLQTPLGPPLVGCRLALAEGAVTMLHPLRVTQPVA
nr:unnamed protein product [Rangifer tarandus platyrhynchus]